MKSAPNAGPSPAGRSTVSTVLGRTTATIRAILVLTAIVLVGPFVDWDGSALAYEGDHYAWTYYLALQVGFTRRQAFQIASGAYALDWDPNLSPMDAAPGDMVVGANHALFGVFGNKKPQLADKWRDFHAFADESVLNNCPSCPVCDWTQQRENRPNQCLATIMSPLPISGDNINRACSAEVASQVGKIREDQRSALFDLARSEGNPGVLLHFTQDYYAHFQFDNFRGHFFAAHMPDHLAFSAAKAECMTRDTLKALTDFRESVGSFGRSEGSQLLPQIKREPDMTQILRVLTELLEANPIMGSWNPFESPSNLSLGGSTPQQSREKTDAAVPSMGRSVLVVDHAIIEDEAAGRLPKWPHQLPINKNDLLPPTFFKYRYDQQGHILHGLMPGPVEQVKFVFPTPEVKITPGDSDSVKVHLRATYTIEGLAEMWDYDILNKYLTPLPIIESDQLSDESSPTEHDQRYVDGTYTIERDVERRRAKLDRGELKWTVAVHLHGYEQQQQVITLRAGGEIVAAVDLCANGRSFTPMQRGRRMVDPKTWGALSAVHADSPEACQSICSTEPKCGFYKWQPRSLFPDVGEDDWPKKSNCFFRDETGELALAPPEWHDDGTVSAMKCAGSPVMDNRVAEDPSHLLKPENDDSGSANPASGPENYLGHER